MLAFKRHVARDEDSLKRLLDGLLRKEAGNMIGHVVMVYECAQSGLIADGLR